MVSGNTTASGNARSTEPSYSYSSRSSGLDRTQASPTTCRRSLNDRIKLQKLVYLAQAATGASVYSFNPYIRGPYSPSLTRDLYSLLEPGQLSEAEERAASYKLNTGAMERLERVKRVVSDKSDTPYVEWLELVASLHVKFEKRPAKFDLVWEEVTAWKRNIFEKSIAQAAWKSLEENGLVKVPN